MPSKYGEPGSWAGARVARPARDLDRSTLFYRDLLDLRVTGGFRDHDGYDGVFFALPGGCELELTAGPAECPQWSGEDLLVLYLDDADELRTIGQRLADAGAPEVRADNPYWNRTGRSFLDPDGYRVVVAVRERDDRDVTVDWHSGPRAELRPFFELAEDSAEQLDGYFQLGRVLVARSDGRVLGHLQLVDTGAAGGVELKSMGVLPAEQGRGIGRRLVAEAIRRSADEGRRRMVVSTATASVGNLRFYQRVGFRMDGIDRDAFTPATGYPEPIFIDGVPLRDRVWFSRDLTG